MVFSEITDLYSFHIKPEIDYIQLNWNNENILSNEKVEISTVIKKIGQGRKPFSNSIILDNSYKSHKLEFDGLSDVFIRFRIININRSIIYEKIERTEVLKKDVKTLVLDGRKIYVFLPPNYSVTENPYDVLLMQDGQNLFSNGTATGPTEWKVDETISELVNSKKIKPLVVIGISSSTDRVSAFWPKTFGYSEGKGEEYGKWITEKLVPLLQNSFNLTKDRWGVAGSSYGAVISLFLGFNYRDHFSKIGAISPAMDLGGQQFISNQPIGLEKIYFDAGEKEQYKIIDPNIFNFPKNSIALTKALIQNGYEYEKNIAFYEDPLKDSHKEDVVAARLSNMILFLYGEVRTEESKQEFVSESFPGMKNRIKIFSDGLMISKID